MAVTRLERKAQKNKSRAKERTKEIKRNVKRLYIKSPFKDESGIILEGDVTTIAAQLTSSTQKSQPKAQATAKSSKTADNDLTKIEGIGPKIASVLMEAGITSFQLLADSTPEQIREILDNAEGNFAAHDPGTWSKQAALAASGNWDELKAWQDELNGGK